FGFRSPSRPGVGDWSEGSQPALNRRGGIRLMRIAPLADVKARWSAYLDECGVEGPIVITRDGKAVAVLLVPYDDNDLERLMLGRSPRFQALLDRSRRSIKKGNGLSEEAVWEAVRKRAQERRAGKAGTAKGRRKRKVHEEGAEK